MFSQFRAGDVASLKKTSASKHQAEVVQTASLPALPLPWLKGGYVTRPHSTGKRADGCASIEDPFDRSDHRRKDLRILLPPPGLVLRSSLAEVQSQRYFIPMLSGSRWKKNKRT